MLFDSGASIDATDAVSKMVLKEQFILHTVCIYKKRCEKVRCYIDFDTVLQYM